MTYNILLLLTSFILSCLPRPIPVQSSCETLLPQDAGMILKNQFPDWKVVSLDDLGLDEQHLWVEKHGSRCPGIVEGQFDSSSPSYAVTLVQKRGNQTFQTLLLLHKHASQYSIVTIVPEEIASHPSVLTRVPPGQYSDWDDSKKVRTHFDGISYEAIEVGAVMFYWDGNRYRTLQLSE